MKSVFNTIYRGGGERGHTDVSSAVISLVSAFPNTLQHVAVLGMMCGLSIGERLVIFPGPYTRTTLLTTAQHTIIQQLLIKSSKSRNRYLRK